MKRKPKTPPEPQRLNRCDTCGVAVPRAPFEPTDAEPRWSRCDSCRDSDAGALTAALLARMGIEADPSAAEVVLALRRTPWKARAATALAALALADSQVDSRLPAGLRRRPLERAQASADTLGQPSTEPWAHVDARRLRREVETARAELATPERPNRCTDGPCGACGVRLAVRWVGPVQMAAVGLRPVRWPLCGACEQVLDAAGGTPTSERARRRFTADLLGITGPVPMSVPPVVRYYAEWVEPGTDPRPDEGCVARWGYVSESDRAALAAQAPQHRPPEVLDRETRARAAASRIRSAAQVSPPRSALLTLTGEDR